MAERRRSVTDEPVKVNDGVSNSALRPEKRKKKKKRSRFMSLRGHDEADQIEDEVEEVTTKKRHASTLNSPKKSHSSWDFVKETATKLKHSDSYNSGRVSGNVTVSKMRSPTLDTKQTPERTFNNAAFSNESFPFPGLPGDPSPTNNRRFANVFNGEESKGAISNMSLPTRKIGGMLRDTHSSSKKVTLPGFGTSKRKAKNLVHYVPKKMPEISQLDRGKIAPLLHLSSKGPLLLKFSSSECKLMNTKFLFEFPDNIEEISFEDNLLSSFPEVSHLHSLKRFYLGGNKIPSFSLKGLDSLLLLSLQENEITKIPKLDACDSLLHLDVRGNSILDGFENLSVLKNLEFLDLNQCEIDLDIEDFDNLILPHLQSLTKLKFLTIGENPALKQFLELKYWIIDGMPNLQYYDCIEITPGLRATAADVKKYGMDATKESWKAQKEDIRLKDNSTLRKTNKLSKKILPKSIVLSKSALWHLFSFLTDKELALVRFVCQKWFLVASDVYEFRNAKIFDRYTILVGSTFYRRHYTSLVENIKNSPLLLNIKCTTVPIDRFVGFNDRIKIVIILINKGNLNDYWHALYDQLAYLYCSIQCDENTKAFQYLHYAIYELQDDSLAAGIDSLLQSSGAKRLHKTGTPSQSFDNWITSVTNSIAGAYEK